MDKRCKTCIHYYHPYKNGVEMCEYILNTGEPRPCPAGDKCTVYKKKKGAKKII